MHTNTRNSLILKEDVEIRKAQVESQSNWAKWSSMEAVALIAHSAPILKSEARKASLSLATATLVAVVVQLSYSGCKYLSINLGWQSGLCAQSENPLKWKRRAQAFLRALKRFSSFYKIFLKSNIHCVKGNLKQSKSLELFALCCPYSLH